MNKIREIESKLSDRDLDRVVEMAWEDRTSFDAIFRQFGIAEQTVIELMRRNISPGAFRRWRKRVQNRATKHESLSEGNDRFKCTRQRDITMNKISKR